MGKNVLSNVKMDKSSDVAKTSRQVSIANSSRQVSRYDTYQRSILDANVQSYFFEVNKFVSFI